MLPVRVAAVAVLLARAAVTVAGRKVGQVTRPFRITRPARANTSAEETRVPAAGRASTIVFTSRMDAFERTSVPVRDGVCSRGRTSAGPRQPVETVHRPITGIVFL
jgi:hypothetical protein